MALPETTTYTEAEYLAFDLDSEIKNEFANGEIIAMAGAHPDHNRVVGDTFASIHRQLLASGNCEIFDGSQRVQIRGKNSNIYRYPDMTVVCGKAQFADTNPPSLTNPTVLIEVLSPSTKSIDYVQKLQEYRDIASVQEYLIISVSEPRIERYLRQNDNTWIFSDIRGIDSQLDLPAIGCSLKFSDVYRRVQFETDDK